MPSVGTRLREARAERGSTLEEISARTRISLKNLNAIEVDDLTQLSSPFLYRSFVRQFAEEVNLEYGSLASDVQAASGSMPQPRVPGQHDIEAVRGPRIRPRVRFDFRWLYPGVAFVLIVAACSSFNTLRLRLAPAMARNSSAAVTMEPPAQTAPPASPAATQLSPPPRQHSRAAKPADRPRLDGGTASAPAESSMVPPADGSPVAEAESAIHIELSAIESTWLSITADGKQTYSGILEAAETKILEGHETARIRTGNAGGVNVVFNGKALGTLGRRGQTRTVLFTRNGYEVLEPSAMMELTRLNRNGE